jgi:hypothetical protein
MLKRSTILLAAACFATSAAAQAPDIINWCNRYNRDATAAARCIRAETGQVSTGTLLEQAAPVSPPPVQQPAQDPPADPYVDSVNKARHEGYLRAKARILDEIRFLGYAGACHAVLDGLALGRADQIFSSFYSDPEVRRMGIGADSREIHQAMRDGADRAQNERCKFFDERPELVLKLRQEVGQE